MVLHDFHAREENRKKGGDELLHRQVTNGRVPVGSLRVTASFQLHETIDVVGNLDSGEVLATVVLDGDGQVQAQPAHERERVCRIDGQRVSTGKTCSLK